MTPDTSETTAPAATVASADSVREVADSDDEAQASPTESADQPQSEASSSRDDGAPAEEPAETPADATSTAATPPAMRVRPRTTTRADGVLDLTFDDFEFDIEKDAEFDRSMLSEKIESFDGKEILVRGFILDSSVFQLKNIKQFVLVRDNQQCCFGPGAYLFHNMQVEMVPGATANFSIRPVTVQGTFRIKPWIGPDGKCYSVYHVTAKSVD